MDEINIGVIYTLSNVTQEEMNWIRAGLNKLVIPTSMQKEKLEKFKKQFEGC